MPRLFNESTAFKMKIPQEVTRPGDFLRDFLWVVECAIISFNLISKPTRPGKSGVYPQKRALSLFL